LGSELLLVASAGLVDGSDVLDEAERDDGLLVAFCGQWWTHKTTFEALFLPSETLKKTFHSYLSFQKMSFTFKFKT
jgi:hypothetical protein